MFCLFSGSVLGVVIVCCFVVLLVLGLVVVVFDLVCFSFVL